MECAVRDEEGTDDRENKEGEYDMREKETSCR